MSQERGKDKAKKFVSIWGYRFLLFPILVAVISLPSSVRNWLYLILFIIFLLTAFFYWPQTWLIALFIIPLQELAPPLFNLPKLLPHRFILVFVALAFLLKILLKKDGDWKRVSQILKNPIFLTFSSFIMANLVSAFYHRSLDALFRSLTYFEPLLYFGLTWFWANLEKGQLTQFLGNFLIAGFWVQIIGVIEMVTQKSIRRLLSVPSETPWEYLFAENRFGLGGRISSTLSHPVYAGLYFIFLLLLTLYLFSLLKDRRKSWLLLLVPLNLVLILATGTRAVVICLVLSLLILGSFLYRQKKLLIPIMATSLTVLIFLLFLFPQILFYFQKSFHLKSGLHESANIRHRIILTRTFIQIFKSKPIFGNGPGLIQKEALKSKDPQWQKLSGIENQYAIILADGGLLAGLTYLAFIIAAFFQIIRLGSKLYPPEISSGRFFLLAYFVAYLFFIITETCLTLAPNFVLMSWLGAFASNWGHKSFPSLDEKRSK